MNAFTVTKKQRLFCVLPIAAIAQAVVKHANCCKACKLPTLTNLIFKERPKNFLSCDCTRKVEQMTSQVKKSVSKMETI